MKIAQPTPARFWMLWAGLFAAGRVLLVIWLYATLTPTGNPLVENWTRFLPHALVAEAGVVAALAFAGMLADCASRGRARRTAAGAATVLAVLYLVAAYFDSELVRWMNQHLSISWMSNYLGRGMDVKFTSQILRDGLSAFFVGFGMTATVSALMVWWTRRVPRAGRLSAWTLAPALILALAGCSSRWWLAPSTMRWRRIQPVVWVVASDVAYRVGHAVRPAHYRAGIRWLITSGEAGARPQPGDFPFWKVEPGEDASMAAFRARPADRQPDVVVLQLESLRGWTVDVRDPAACAHLPNLCALAARGTFFPYAHSVGFPSVEGFAGLHLGIWSHPEGILLNDRANLRMRSLPDILARAGYFRAAMTATEPSFDNLTIWFNRWYDFWEFNPDRRADGPLARRFAGLYREWPRDRPLFATWFSTSTHLPFRLPPDHGPDPKDPGKRYARALAYMDSSVGVILNAIRENPRGRPTLIIAMGDHSTPNSRLVLNSDEEGVPGQGHTWTSLWLAGPGVAAGRVDVRPVSQVDVAPTVLAALGLRASNHFMGRSLLTPEAGMRGPEDCSAGSRVLSFRMGGMTSQRGACRYALRLDDPDFLRAFRQELHPAIRSPIRSRDDAEDYGGDAPAALGSADAPALDSMRWGGESWRWILDHNLLRP